MSPVIYAERLISDKDFPSVAGQKLATQLLDNEKQTWSNLVIAVSSLDPATLISVFFNSFLETILETKPDVFPNALKIKWITRYDFQQENIRRWVGAFRPRDLRPCTEDDELSFYDFQAALNNVLLRDLSVSPATKTRKQWCDSLRDALFKYEQLASARMHKMRFAEYARTGQGPQPVVDYESCVHTDHCCVDHGCKYGNDDCPVENGTKPQSFYCEDCEFPPA